MKLTKFSENEHFLPPDTHTQPRYAHVGVRIREYEIFLFQIIWQDLFFCYLQVDIRSFVLSLTNYCNMSKSFVAYTTVLNDEAIPLVAEGKLLILINSM